MAALVCLPMKWRIAVPAVCFVAYGLIVHLCGDYTMTGNAAEHVEQAVLSALLPAGSKAIRELGELGYLGQFHEIGEIHYTWILTTPMFVFMTACGYFSTKMLQGAVAPMRRFGRLAAFGAALLALGWILALCGVKMVKHIFAVSFTAQAMGWSALLLAAAYLVADIWRMRKGIGLFTLFGRTSLVAYMIGEFFWPCFMFFGNYLTKGLAHLMGEPAQGVFACLVDYNGLTYKAMANIGHRPTIGDRGEDQPIIEVNLFDFDGDLYGKQIRVRFIDRIRDEEKFDGLDALKAQLEQDREKAYKLLDNIDL